MKCEVGDFISNSEIEISIMTILYCIFVYINCCVITKIYDILGSGKASFDQISLPS